VLGDAEKRKKYDALGENWKNFQSGQAYTGGNPFGNFNFGTEYICRNGYGRFHEWEQSIFRFFNAFFGGGKRAKSSRFGGTWANYQQVPIMKQ
jgi:curved DNA-binding protein